MDYLIEQCGGDEAGMHRFVPHCTLLYNTAFPQHNNMDICKGSSKEEDAKSRQQQEGENILRQCLRDYCKQHQTEQMAIKLIPTSHYYFPYPKTADNGKGFGCAISLLILETTPELAALHEVVSRIFPPDERHGGGDKVHEYSNQQQQHDDGASPKEEVEFRPHMALIYASEEHDNVTNGWLEEHTKQLEQNKQYLNWMGDAAVKCEGPAAWDAKYLSLWSTEGTIDEWYPIAKLDLLPT